MYKIPFRGIITFKNWFLIQKHKHNTIKIRQFHKSIHDYCFWHNMQIKLLFSNIERFILFSYLKNFWTSRSFGIFSNSKIAFILEKSLWKVNYQINSWIDTFFFGLIKNYKHYLELKGTGYKFRLLNQIYFFGLTLRLGVSHILFIPFYKNFRIFFINRHILCLYNNNLWSLNNQIQLIKIQNKPNSYKEKGIFWKNSIIKLKKSTKLKF